MNQKKTIFRLLRGASGMTGADAADFLGVAPNTLRIWESEKHPKAPAEKHVLKLAKLVIDQLESSERINILKGGKRIPDVQFVENDDEARAMGFPKLEAQHRAAAYEIAIALVDGVEIYF